eukprot:Seg557.7 transcript_id=Seg557.7/GoldUCD/mRNA.D3Y31 product="hypothetical protein" pseudo=true protein_id=Seg557.7/GoldUCD/D3Y31
MDTEKRLAEDEMSDDVPDEQENTKTASKVETKWENAKRARIGREKFTKKETQGQGWQKMRWTRSLKRL